VIAVTAASGHLGRLALAEAARVRPGEVVAVVRDPSRLGSVPDGVQVRIADYGDREGVAAALTGVEGVLMISSSEVGNRVEHHRSVIDAARDAGVAKLVYTSAPRATTSPLVLVADHKATEEYLAESGLSWTVARHNWYHENYVPNLAQVARTGVLLSAAGEGRVASARRADFAAGDIALLTGPWRDGAVYELGGDEAWDFRQLADWYADALDRPVEYRPVDPADLVTELVAAGVPEGGAQFAAAVDAGIAQGALAEVTGELSRLLGRPTTPMPAALREAAAAL
jgi:NAD(P)H dehydrogenase (quinone)